MTGVDWGTLGQLPLVLAMAVLMVFMMRHSAQEAASWRAYMEQRDRRQEQLIQRLVMVAMVKSDGKEHDEVLGLMAGLGGGPVEVEDILEEKGGDKK